MGTLCPVAEDVVAIHNRTHIKFVFLRTGKSRLLVPSEHRGVGAMGGRDDISVLAWSDIGPPAPKIHVYKYGDPQNIIDLEGKSHCLKFPNCVQKFNFQKNFIIEFEFTSQK